MELIDDSGFVLGKINIIDILVVLLSIAIITVGIALVTASSESETLTQRVHVRTAAHPAFVLEAIPVGPVETNAIVAVSNKTISRNRVNRTTTQEVTRELNITANRTVTTPLNLTDDRTIMVAINDTGNQTMINQLNSTGNRTTISDTTITQNQTARVIIEITKTTTVIRYTADLYLRLIITRNDEGLPMFDGERLYVGADIQLDFKRTIVKGTVLDLLGSPEYVSRTTT